MGDNPERPDRLPAAPLGRRETRVSYRGTSHDPHGTREAVFSALYEEATGQPADEYLERPGETVEQALTAAAQPQTQMRFTYPIQPCTCWIVGSKLPGGSLQPHLMTDDCPMPTPLRSELSKDGGRTWQDVPG